MANFLLLGQTWLAALQQYGRETWNTHGRFLGSRKSREKDGIVVLSLSPTLLNWRWTTARPDRSLPKPLIYSVCGVVGGWAVGRVGLKRKRVDQTSKVYMAYKQSRHIQFYYSVFSFRTVRQVFSFFKLLLTGRPKAQPFPASRYPHTHTYAIWAIIQQIDINRTATWNVTQSERIAEL